jgi:putative DNA primase/helicase
MNDTYFRCLGYNDNYYYIYQFEKKQIKVMSNSEFTTAGFLSLAPEEYWLALYPTKTGFDKQKATNDIIRDCYKIGIYDPTKVRGRGAWIDNNRTVYHFGSHLLINGMETPVHEIKSRYVYPLAQSFNIKTDAALSDEDGRKLLETAKMFRWNKPASAALLLGWCALAPLCGALRWRPHIWLTGGAGCGKSTILNEYIHYLMGGIDIFAQGNSTEAGIRQELHMDALPVVFDETEQNNDREESRMQNILSLIRQASTESGAVTLKGTATGESMKFLIRSMFCLSSIGVGIKHQADYERLTILSLRKKSDDADASGSWDALKTKLIDMKSDESMPNRFFMRALTLLPITTSNIAIFVKVASKRFNSVREGDQYGTLLAGCWSMLNSTIATEAQAQEMIDSFDWEEYRENAEVDDSSRALQTMLESRIKISGSYDVSLYEIIMCAVNGISPTGVEKVDRIMAEAILNRHGMKTKMGKFLLISNKSQAVADLFKQTSYATDWRNQILRCQGVKRHDKSERFNGTITKCIEVPIESIGVTPF